MFIRWQAKCCVQLPAKLPSRSQVKHYKTEQTARLLDFWHFSTENNYQMLKIFVKNAFEMHAWNVPFHLNCLIIFI